MEAPDKIYIGLINSEFGGVVYDTVSATFPNAKEYIRKEALLEKLRKAAASYKKRSDEGELVWQNMCGINEAINILNEM